MYPRHAVALWLGEFDPADAQVLAPFVDVSATSLEVAPRPLDVRGRSAYPNPVGERQLDVIVDSVRALQRVPTMLQEAPLMADAPPTAMSRSRTRTSAPASAASTAAHSPATPDRPRRRRSRLLHGAARHRLSDTQGRPVQARMAYSRIAAALQLMSRTEHVSPARSAPSPGPRPRRASCALPNIVKFSCNLVFNHSRVMQRWATLVT